ncbi:hypothetical protein [Bythopirellula polymerisocia]|uniref:PEP-CTERM protein-sorting domain-containing protein n=1 Tax=Bythopirellula polymerisocia TaxID=2528003 RepID=A0A5C6C3V2_9BACT|nr:hypothetical protein [Bythopirellula polymerisocia]TWU17469.1 hypothetical protein Pla144_51220 [Bythopirellula polymerisocia]
MLRNTSVWRSALLVASIEFMLNSGIVRGAGPYSENWDVGDTNGWMQSTTSSTVIRDNTEGNPVSSLAVRRILSQPIFDIGVTTDLAAVSGDYTGVPTWMLSFDAKYDVGNYSDTWLRFRYQDSTFEGWHLDVADVFPNSWESYSIMFNPGWTSVQAAANGWQDETGGTVSWQQLMSNVFHPEVRFLLSDEGSAIAHVDNIALKAIPEPTVFSLAAIAGLTCIVIARHRVCI